MRSRIIFKYLFTELISPFFLGLTVFIFILIMSQILRLNELIIVHGVGIWSVVKLVFFLLTAFLAVSIPIALLFSVLSLFGRLSQDSEMVALRASGFSLFQLAIPVLTFSVIVCFFCLFLTLYVEAWGARSYKSLVWQIGKSKATIGLKAGVFNDDFFGYVLYTGKVNPENKTLEDIFIYDDRDQTGPVTVVAKKGALISSEDLPSVFLVLQNGTIHSSTANYKSLQKINFDTYTINLSIDELVKGRGFKEKPQRIPIWLLKQRIKEAKAQGDVPKERLYRTEYHRKFSIAFSSLVFALLAISFGIKPTRSAKSGSFVFTLLFVVAYWAMVMLGRSLAVHGTLHPGIAMWMANFVFLSVACLLFYRTSKH